MVKCLTVVQLVFVCDTILLIKKIIHCKLIYQKKEKQIIYDNICKNTSAVVYNYQVSDKLIPSNKVSKKIKPT